MDDDTVRAAAAKKSSPFLTTDQAAFYVGLSARTLERMRWACRGPRFRRHGRYVRYHIIDLEEWSAKHGYRSTAEAATDAIVDHGTGSNSGHNDAPHAQR